MKKQIVLTCPVCGKSEWLESVEHEDGFYYPCACCGEKSRVDNMCSEEVDSKIDTELRDDLIFSVGYKAAFHVIGVCGFAMPDDIEGFHEASVFAAECVDEYIASNMDEPFDLYIEKALMAKYGNK